MDNKATNKQRVSFKEYFINDGNRVKVIGSPLNGAVLLFHTMPYSKGKEKVASVLTVDGYLFFVPFESLTFLS